MDDLKSCKEVVDGNGNSDVFFGWLFFLLHPSLFLCGLEKKLFS